MGARSTPASPSTGSDAKDPVKKTNEECDKEKKCWVDDYEKEISTASYGRYSQPYKADGSAHSYTDKVQYKLYAPVKTGTEITVEIRFKVEKDADVTDEQVTSSKSKLETGVSTYWDNKFTLETDDPECGKKSFKIRYKIVWVDSGQHYTLKVHKTYPRAGVLGNVLDVSKDKTDWVYAHEVAHCFGLPDEYSYTADDETVKYYKPDGTLDSAVSAPTFKAKDAPDATIMSSSGNTTVLKRHQWYVAIETRDLLTSKLGRKIKCDIK
jgi:type VI secretion system secreted protein VgrG